LVDFSKYSSVDEHVIRSENLPEKQTLPVPKKEIKKPKKLTKKENRCPTCKKKLKITGEKQMSKNQLIEWFKKYISENKNNFPLDWLRGQKLTFESIKRSENL
jgi:uncharacterized protein with PIN domain